MSDRSVSLRSANSETAEPVVGPLEVEQLPVGAALDDEEVVRRLQGHAVRTFDEYLERVRQAAADITISVSGASSAVYAFLPLPTWSGMFGPDGDDRRRFMGGRR
jgi:hypothetical protein